MLRSPEPLRCAASAYGGAALLVRTIQDLVHIPIDHVAIIGFEGFKAMTNARVKIKQLYDALRSDDMASYTVNGSK